MIRVMLSGYEHLTIGKTSVLAAKLVATDIQAVLQREELYEYASQVGESQVLQGRAPVYVIPFGSSQLRVAVRHGMRGGLIARLIRDRFLPPTRVRTELLNSIQLSLAGIITPDVLAVITYSAGGPFHRADVMTRYIEGVDLAAVFSDPRNDPQRRLILDAVAKLLSKLSAVGAQHQDLNLKNVLLTTHDTGYTAVLLDVDRVHFHFPGDPIVARANLTRLIRSLRKWRLRPETRRDALPDMDLDYLALAAATLTPT
jgi:hypothetical protein